MKYYLSNQWIIAQFSRDAFHNKYIAVYRDGCQKSELKTILGEMICASLEDNVYLSDMAIHYRNTHGAYIRLSWNEIAEAIPSWKKIKGKERPVAAMRYKTVSGEIHIAILDDASCQAFYDVNERFVRELGRGGKNVRFHASGERVGSVGKRFEEWLKKQNRADWQEDGTALLAIADTCDSIISSGILTPEQRKIITDAVSHSHTMIWSNTVEMIWGLEERGFNFGETLWELSSSKKANVRYAAICCVSDQTDHTIAIEILTAALSDKSEKVREKAVEKKNTMNSLQEEIRQKWINRPSRTTIAELLSQSLIDNVINDGLYQFMCISSVGYDPILEMVRLDFVKLYRPSVFETSTDGDITWTTSARGRVQTMINLLREEL